MRVALAADDVAEDLADGVPGRELRLQPVGERDELEAVDDLLARVLVVGPPSEVALHVREAEQRLRPDVFEAGHPGEADLERDRDVALDLLGAPARGLRDDLDERRHRVRIGLDVEPLVGNEPRDDEREYDDHHRRRRVQGNRDETPNHRLEHSEDENGP